MILASIILGLWIFTGCCTVSDYVTAQTTTVSFGVSIVVSIIGLIFGG